MVEVAPLAASAVTSPPALKMTPARAGRDGWLMERTQTPMRGSIVDCVSTLKSPRTGSLDTRSWTVQWFWALSAHEKAPPNRVQMTGLSLLATAQKEPWD